MMYEWRMPDDVAALERLVDEIVERRVGAIAFTSQIQARHLFQVADRMGRKDELRAALTRSTIVASVGPTCTRALEALGVTPHVAPENPKMGSMVAELGAYLVKNSESARA
jgi:uroporphyrinogen-III synthase